MTLGRAERRSMPLASPRRGRRAAGSRPQRSHRRSVDGVGLVAAGGTGGGGAVATAALVRFATATTTTERPAGATTATRTPRRTQYVWAGSGPTGWSMPLMAERLRSRSESDRAQHAGSARTVRVRWPACPPTIAVEVVDRVLAGTTTTLATCPGAAPRRARGRSWSASSCCSRPRWRGCWSRGGAGSTAGPPRRLWPPRRPARPSAPGAGWATRVGRCGCTERRRPSPSSTTARCPTELRRPAGPARRRLLHRGGDRLVRVRAAARRAGHQRPPGAGPGRLPGRRIPPAAGDRGRDAARRRRTCRTEPARAARWAVASMELGRPGLHRPDAGAASAARSRDLCAWQAAGPTRHGRAAAAAPDVRGHRPTVPGRAAGRAAVERRAGRLGPSWTPSGRTPTQRERALASLVADGLVVGDDDRGYALPG